MVALFMLIVVPAYIDWFLWQQCPDMEIVIVVFIACIFMLILLPHAVREGKEKGRQKVQEMVTDGRITIVDDNGVPVKQTPKMPAQETVKEPVKETKFVNKKFKLDEDE